ncbi:MAG: hypothetical protein ACG0KC_01490 [Enterobacteriaceae bacterium]
MKVNIIKKIFNLNIIFCLLLIVCFRSNAEEVSLNILEENLKTNKSQKSNFNFTIKKENKSINLENYLKRKNYSMIFISSLKKDSNTKYENYNFKSRFKYNLNSKHYLFSQNESSLDLNKNNKFSYSFISGYGKKVLFKNIPLKTEIGEMFSTEIIDNKNINKFNLYFSVLTYYSFRKTLNFIEEIIFTSKDYGNLKDLITLNIKITKDIYLRINSSFDLFNILKNIKSLGKNYETSIYLSYNL